jgi:hypothetical protein
MTADMFVLRFLLFTFAGWVNRQQQLVREYLVEVNRVRPLGTVHAAATGCPAPGRISDTM